MNIEIMAGRADGFLVDQIVAMPGLPLRGAVVADEGNVEQWLQRSIRRARMIVAEYARASGMRDPEVVADFSRSCVARALKGTDLRRASATLCEEAIKIAVHRVGLGVSRTPAHSERAAHHDKEVVRSGAPCSQSIFVPRQIPQIMPSQPLGELPPLIQPGVWRRLATAVVGLYSGVAARLRDGAIEQSSSRESI